MSNDRRPTISLFQKTAYLQDPRPAIANPWLGSITRDHDSARWLVMSSEQRIQASLPIVRPRVSTFLFQCTAYMFVEIFFSVFSLVVLVFILFSVLGFDFSLDTAFQDIALFSRSKTKPLVWPCLPPYHFPWALSILLFLFSSFSFLLFAGPSVL